MRSILVALLSLTVVAFFTGDLIQQHTGLSWQHDGGHEGDAGDLCTLAHPALTLGESAEGQLVPRLDEADFYLLPIPLSAVRTLVTVQLVEVQFDANLTVYAPDCTFDLAQLPEQEGSSGHEGQNGKGHGKCKGQGHLDHVECLVTNVTVGDDELSFVPLRPVTFIVGATLNLTTPLPDLEPVPRSCHQSCLNQVLGYRINPG